MTAERLLTLFFLVEGQVCGAFAMGLGGALTEHIQYDANGIQLTKSFKDYVMLRMADIPANWCGLIMTPQTQIIILV